PNFPTQVMEASDAELYLNAIVHYLGDWIGARILPNYKKLKREPLKDKIALKVIDLGTEAEFCKICENLLASKTSISETDKADVTWFVENYGDNLQAIVPAAIPLKENIAYFCALLLKNNIKSLEKVENYVASFIKTATDVLRLAAAMSNGDVSLAEPTKFVKFKRAERKFLLSLLENAGNITEDMLRYPERWKRLGEILHPGEYKNRFAKTAKSFNILRNNNDFLTFNAKVEAALVKKDTNAVADLLKTRAGEFARRLDHLLRLVHEDTKKVEKLLSDFQEVAENVATPVLLQVRSHFIHRNSTHRESLRTFFPKGNLAKVQAIKNELPFVNKQTCIQLAVICENALLARFANLPSLGKVYLEEKMQDYLVPFSQRSASKALRTAVRGSKISMPEGNTIRFFLWWKEGKVNDVPTGRVDIDLSASLYGKTWNYMEHISYTNLRSATYNAAHSGDITSAPNGACEFIDLDINSIVKYGGRYVVMSLHSFTSQPYCNLPECFAGWMMRQKPKSGEIFEPKTVQDKIDVTADTQIAVPVILDLVERKVIWADIALKSDPYYYNNVEGNGANLVLMGKALSSLTKPNLYDLLFLHAVSRGELVEDKTEADTIFAVNEGVTPFDTEVIMGEYL
ncbi:MAG: TerD family protein, partial [Bacteroidia bacterium]